MFDWDKWQEILHSLQQNKLRTALTAFGVFWGILMLIMLLGGGTGLRNGVEDMFRSDIRHKIEFGGGRTSLAYKSFAPDRSIQLTGADLAAIKNQLTGIDSVSAFKRLSGSGAVSYGDKSASFTVYGVADDYFKIKAFQDYHFGRRLNKFDNKESRKVATIGTRVAEAFFPAGSNPVGKHIMISGIPFKVVGLFYDSDRQGRMSEYIYIPLHTLQQTFASSQSIDRIIVAPNRAIEIESIEKIIKRLLKARHRVDPDDPRAIWSRSPTKETKKLEALFSAIDALIWFVGLGTLVAGVIGVSNIMIIVVKERTREIGVRKALGATPRSIVSLILMESIVVTAVAGNLGLMLGVGLLEAVKYLLALFNIELLFFARPEIDFNVAMTALLLLISVGAIAGLVPAIQAAKITPMEAMRNE